MVSEDPRNRVVLIVVSLGYIVLVKVTDFNRQENLLLSLESADIG